MRFSIIAIATFLIGFGLMSTADVQAQSQAVNVTTTVKEAITLNSPAGLSFGDVATNSSPEVDPHTDGTNTDVNNANVTVGEVEVSGPTSASLYVEISEGSSISLDDGGNSITYTPWLIGNTTKTSGDFNTGTATLIYKSDGTTDTQNITSASSQDGSGNVYYMKLGGSLSSITNTGSYSGTATITVTYQ